MRPLSHGSVTLRSSDPADHPVIEPNYLSEHQDRRDLLEGVRIARDIASARALDRFRSDEILAKGSGGDGIAEAALSGYHPVGTCRMGADGDPLAVTDRHLAVRGIDNLRIVDASVLPVMVAGNLNGPLMALAWRAAERILGER